jgi:23S rRNA (adenine2503-C2)-methyltransferase
MATARSSRQSRAEARLPSILDLSKPGLVEAIQSMGEPAFRGRQVWKALYADLTASFDEMTTLPRSLRAMLAERYDTSPLQPLVKLRSKDRLVEKVLFRLADGELIETVLMRYGQFGPARARRTVCISTQAGCALGCTFCATGQQGFRRHLSAGEIVGQVMHMARIVRAERERKAAEGRSDEVEKGTDGASKRDSGSRADVGGKADAASRSLADDRPDVTNVVFMGMGEPLANYSNTMAAIATLNDAEGLNIGARHMTISTVGLAPQILKLAEEPFQVNLAVSLHAPDDETRSQTMPVNRRYPIASLMEAVRTYILKTNRRVTFEYVLLHGQNDFPQQAEKLASLLSGLLCHVNLIPVNRTAAPYERPDNGRIGTFKDILLRAGIAATVRFEKGTDIDAGCGQLRERVLTQRPGQ